jgi:uncharacterized protein YndB with AHSA1/START domain
VTADPYRQSILIHARQEDVFRYFTEPDAIIAWMGDEAFLDPRPGGQFLLRFEDRYVEGRYIEVDVPNRLVIGWGRRGASGFPPGFSRLEITLTSEDMGTRVEIAHFGLPIPEQKRHAEGWLHYMKRLLRVATGLGVERHNVPPALTEGVDE